MEAVAAGAHADPRRDDRRRAERHGRMAEQAACWLLRLKGYRILALRARTPMGEIDVVARRGSTTAFIEVKARASREDALLAVTPRAARRLAGAARCWVARHGDALDGACRFDVVTVSPRFAPRHVANAFEANAF